MPATIPTDQEFLPKGNLGEQYTTGEAPYGGGGYGGPATGDPTGGGGGSFADILLRSVATNPTEDIFGPRRYLSRNNAVARHYTPISMMAHGGAHPGGWAIVGEEGPEMILLPPGTQVFPNPRSVPHYAYGTGGGASFGGRGQLGRQPRYTQPPTAPSDPTVQIRGGGMGGGAGQSPNYPGAQGGGNDPFTDYGWQGFTDENGQVKPAQAINYLMYLLYHAGGLNPFGSPELAGQIRDSISGSSGARERAAQLGVETSGMNDPAMQAYASLQSRLNTQGEASKAYSDALLASAEHNQDWIRSLLGGPVANAWTRQDIKTPSPWAGLAGDVVGAGVGAGIGALTGHHGSGSAPIANPGGFDPYAQPDPYANARWRQQQIL